MQDRLGSAVTGGGPVRQSVKAFPFAVVVLITGCGYNPEAEHAPSSPREGARIAGTPSIGPDAAHWQVEVGGVRGEDAWQCMVDPVVAETWQTADYPSSAMGLVLTPEGTEEDASRIAACLQTVLPDSEVIIREVTAAAMPTQEPPVTGAQPAGPDPAAPLAPGTTPDPISASGAETIPPCEETVVTDPAQRSGGTTGATSCTVGEVPPLTREEMMNATPMPMPVLPALPTPVTTDTK